MGGKLGMHQLGQFKLGDSFALRALGRLGHIISGKLGMHQLGQFKLGDSYTAAIVGTGMFDSDRSDPGIFDTGTPGGRSG